MSTPEPTAEIGLTGLAVMGSNLARNIARHGHTIAVHNRSTEKMTRLLDEHGDDGDFVGIRQQDASVDTLVELYVDEKAEAGQDATVASDVTDTWQTWSDPGGDHGYSTEVGDEALLVYGSAPVEDLEAYLGLLTR